MSKKIITVTGLFMAIACSQMASADTCWKATYGRGVGVIPSQCNYDQAKSGLLCYPPCRDGYTLVAGVCWQQCASGFKDTGAHCLKPESYGRGGGYAWKIGDSVGNLEGARNRCEYDNVQKNKIEACESAGLGYRPKCKPGFQSRGAWCDPPACPPGTKDIVGLCHKDNPAQPCPPDFKEGNGNKLCLKPTGYVRTASYRSNEKDKCENENQILRCEQSGLLFYPKCGAGFHAVGCCVCSPDCPPGTKDIGVSCQKDSYVVAPITPNCGAQQYDAGLCYDKCRPKFNGIGPVCWGVCPAGMVDCGALCGSSAAECASAIGEMVLSVGSVVAQIAETVFTLGISTSISAATKAALDSAANAIKDVAKNAAKQFAGMAADQIKAKVAGELRNLKLPPAIADKLADMEARPDRFDYVGFIKGLDPTGIVAVVDSFNKKICD